MLSRTLRNGWCTARRFQSEGSCVLGYSKDAQDSIEHYSTCPEQIKFAKTHLKIADAHVGNLQSFLPVDAKLDESLQTRLLLNLYCCYSTTNSVRITGDTAFDVQTCMKQFMEMPVFGHRRSRKILQHGRLG